MSAPNFAQLQRDILHKLLSEPLLADLNIVSLRDLQSLQPGQGDDPQALMNAYLVWTTPRNGGTKIGCGAIVNMPTKEYRAPNVQGPERTCLLTVTTIEDPLTNITASPTATGKTAEEWSDLIEAILHQFIIEQIGIVVMQRSEPNRDIQGAVAYDSKFTCEIPRDDIDEVQCPTQTQVTNQLTLTAATPGSTIYYTKNAADGAGFPGSGNSAAITGASPLTFTVAVNDVIRWAAYKTGMRGSLVAQATVTSIT